MTWLIALFIAVLIIACVITYRTAEVHELHKMRAAFEDHKHILEEFYASKENLEIKGEIEGLDIAIEVVDEEERSL